MLLDDQQRPVQGHGNIASHILVDYKKLLGEKVSWVPIDSEVLTQGPTVTPTYGAELMRPVSEGEVKSALWSIANNKAPEPDGYTSVFFKEC